MNRKILICIGFLILFTLVLCNEYIGQGRRIPKVLTNISKFIFEQN